MHRLVRVAKLVVFVGLVRCTPQPVSQNRVFPGIQCVRDEECVKPRTCIRWTKVSNVRATCEIPCKRDSDCPPVAKCVRLIDGPKPMADFCALPDETRNVFRDYLKRAP